ncbi:MAG: DMT family transporter [Lachnospiraceae bacterium]|nr:DMT family transporter [Lachnospiraceae bacterium]
MKNKHKNLSLFLLLCIIGGTTYAFQKIGTKNGLPLWTAGVRFLIAGCVLLVLSISNKSFKLNKQTLIFSIQYGFLYFAFPFGAIYWVGQFLPSGLLSVLSSSVAAFSVIFNYLLGGEKTNKKQIIGIIFSMIGVFAIFMQSCITSYSKKTLLFLLISLIAYLGAAYATALLKIKICKIDSISFNGVSLLIGAFLLCTSSLIFEQGDRTFLGKSLFSLLYLAIAGSLLATRITTYLMSQWHVAKVTMYRFISPIISLLVGFLLFNEVMQPYEILGTFLIVIGIFFINK